MANLDDVAQQLLQAGLGLPSEKKFYANSFAIGTSPADVVIVLLANGQPTAAINLSYQVAKTLQIKLGELLNGFEEKTGQRIWTTDEVVPALGSKESE
jgi:hypothetical protein